MKLKLLSGLACLVAVCAAPAEAFQTLRMPPARQIVATLNDTDIVLDANKAAATQEEALCVLAVDSLLARGSWDAYAPTGAYWNTQFNAHALEESDRVARKKDAQTRMANFQAYPDAATRLMVHIAIVSRCERAMKAATGAS